MTTRQFYDKHDAPVSGPHADALNAAYDVFHVAVLAHDAAVVAYRTRQIGDAEFLAARKAYKTAQAALDAAEAVFIAAYESASS